MRRETRSILIDKEIFDEYRKMEDTIYFLGIRIYQKNYVQNIDYKQAQLENKSIGFAKSNQNEKTK